MQEQLNGHDLSEEEQNAARDIARIAARDSIAVIEAVTPAPAFEQKAHDLLMESIDRLAQDWHSELQRAIANATVMQEAVAQSCDKMKGDLTRLHLLGALVRQEVSRGDEVCHKINEQIDQMMDAR